MTKALADQPATPFRMPPGVRLVRVDAATGLLPGPDTETVILEAFLPGTEPTTASPPKGATAAIAQEVYLGQQSGRSRNGGAVGPAPVIAPQRSPELRQAPSRSRTRPNAPSAPAPAPSGNPNTGGLY